MPDKINTLIPAINSSVVSSPPVYSSFPDSFTLVSALERAGQASSGRAVPACCGDVHPAPGSSVRMVLSEAAPSSVQSLLV